ncbi:MAG: tetratricopeptide repeat protein [Thermoplasmata archaeon]
MSDEKIICPICARDVDPDTEFCDHCGSPMDEVAADDLEASKLDDSLASLEEIVDEGPETISVCPKCGDLNRTSDTICLTCGFHLTDRPERSTDIAEAPSEEAGIADAMFLCPECGAFLTEEARVCDICGASLSVEKKIGVGDFVTKTEEEGEAVCPECGAYLDESGGKCLICSNETLPESDETPVQKVDIEEDLDKFLEELEATEVSEEVPQDLLVETLEGEITTRKEEAPASERPVLKGPVERRVSPPRIPRRITKEKFIQRRRKQVQRTQEFLAYSSLVALGIFYATGQAGIELSYWIMLVVFGVVFGSGFSLSLTNLPKNWKSAMLKAIPFLGGSVAVVLVPLLYLVGASADLGSIDLTVVVVGGVVSMIGILAMRRDFPAFLIWSTGSLLVFLVSFSSLGLPNPWYISDATAISLWLIGSIYITLGVVLLIRAKWIQTLIDTEILTGDRKYRERRFKESIASYDKAISASTNLEGSNESSPNLDVPWYSKGAALTILGKYEEAIECIDNALKLSPNNEVALVNKGTALSRLGRHKEALKCYNEAIRVNSDYEVAWNNKGNALTRLRRYEEAIKCYDRAIQIDEEYREAWVNKGYVLAKMGDYDGAARCADFVSRFSTLGTPRSTERLIS